MKKILLIVINLMLIQLAVAMKPQLATTMESQPQENGKENSKEVISQTSTALQQSCLSLLKVPKKEGEEYSKKMNGLSVTGQFFRYINRRVFPATHLDDPTSLQLYPEVLTFILENPPTTVLDSKKFPLLETALNNRQSMVIPELKKAMKTKKVEDINNIIQKHALAIPPYLIMLAVKLLHELVPKEEQRLQEVKQSPLMTIRLPGNNTTPIGSPSSPRSPQFAFTPAPTAFSDEESNDEDERPGSFQEMLEREKGK